MASGEVRTSSVASNDDVTSESGLSNKYYKTISTLGDFLKVTRQTLKNKIGRTLSSSAVDIEKHE